MSDPVWPKKISCISKNSAGPKTLYTLSSRFDSSLGRACRDKETSNSRGSVKYPGRKRHQVQWHHPHPPIQSLGAAEKLSVASAERMRQLVAHASGTTIIPSTLYRLERLSVQYHQYTETNKCAKQVTSSGNFDFCCLELPYQLLITGVQKKWRFDRAFFLCYKPFEHRNLFLPCGVEVEAEMLE